MVLTINYHFYLPRYVNLEKSITPFGISLCMHTHYKYPLLFCKLTDGSRLGCEIKPDTTTEVVGNHFRSNGLDLPLEVLEKLLKPFREIYKRANYSLSELTVQEILDSLKTEV